MGIRFTDDELLFFKRNGFVIKRNVLKPELIAKAQEVFWAEAPSQLVKDDPSTWVGPFREEFEITVEDRAPGTDQRKGYRWNLRHIGEDDWMMDMIPRNPDLIGMAEQLLGAGNLVPPMRTRGIYTTLPRNDGAELDDHLHVDQHVFHLGIVAYLGKVVPGGGGFRVWPTSHRWFYNTFKSQYKGTQFNEDQATTNRYLETKEFFETQPSVECTGNTGDVVFWHHRLAHMAGHNTSCNLRQAILYDFKKVDFDYTQELPPQPNMWVDWPGLDHPD